MNIQNPAALHALFRGDVENAIIASTQGGIENQEREGAREFRANDTLPIQCNGCTREQFEAMGIVFGEPVDELFVHVQLPEGWKKIDGGHPYGYWTYIVDSRGCERAAIFYKASFYDRSAHINMLKRFSIHNEYCDECGDSVETENSLYMMIVVKDGGKIIRKVGFVEEKDYCGRDKLYKQANMWLNECYPEWENPLAYWD